MINHAVIGMICNRCNLIMNTSKNNLKLKTVGFEKAKVNHYYTSKPTVYTEAEHHNCFVASPNAFPLNGVFFLSKS